MAFRLTRSTSLTRAIKHVVRRRKECTLTLDQASLCSTLKPELPFDRTKHLLTKITQVVEPPTGSTLGEQTLGPRAGIVLGVLWFGAVVSQVTSNEAYAGGSLTHPSNTVGAFRP